MNANLPIRAIQRGSGEHAMWIRVGDTYARIEQELKDISWGDGTTYKMVVYRVYNKKNDLLIEIESNSSLAIFYGVPIPVKENKPLNELPKKENLAEPKTY